jgi:hypothetical protein
MWVVVLVVYRTEKVKDQGRLAGYAEERRSRREAMDAMWK